jgi:hypothetical protein
MCVAMLADLARKRDILREYIAQQQESVARYTRRAGIAARGLSTSGQQGDQRATLTEARKMREAALDEVTRKTLSLMAIYDDIYRLRQFLAVARREEEIDAEVDTYSKENKEALDEMEREYRNLQWNW